MNDNPKNKIFIETIRNFVKKNNSKLTADKIITTLKTIKNNPNISNKRWIWELMQNATDVKYKNEKISIKIILDNNKLEFMHNGQFFEIGNILGLLQQVSSKNSQNLEGQTGKFGTGFIGTHLLSDIIDVKGILKIDENDFREFKINLDRSENVSEILAKNIEKSIELFYNYESSDSFKLRENYLQNRKETDYDTTFTYYLKDEEKKQAAKEGLKDLENTLPITLITLHNKIKQVTIIDNLNDNLKKKEKTYIAKFDKEIENNISESYIEIIYNNEKEKDRDIYNFLSYLKVNKENNKEILRLIMQIKVISKAKIKLLKRNENEPVLYRNFPLIGSNEFNMPFIVDGFNFNPIESRSGLLLNGGNYEKNLDVQENFSILSEAYDSSIKFIELILKKYNSKQLEDIFLLANSKFPKPINEFDEYAKNWFLEKQKYFREKISYFNFIKNPETYKLNQLLLPVFNEKMNFEFYNIVSKLNTRKKQNKIFPDKKDYQDWFYIIIEQNNDIKGIKIKNNQFIKTWGSTKNEETGEMEINYIYDLEDFLRDIKNCGNIKNLSDKTGKDESEAIEYLNDFIKFLKENCNYEEILNKYPIIPNRNGDFKKIDDLYSDINNAIPKIIMDIYDSISEKKLKEELVDEKINTENLGDNLKKKDFDFISKKLNSYILENKNIDNIKKLVVYPLLSIKSDKEEVSQIYKFLNYFDKFNQNFKLKEIDNFDNKIKIPDDLWSYAIKFWFTEHPKEIESYINIEGLKNNLLENIDVLLWMNSYLDYLKLHSSNRNFENLKIFPNQNGNFCELNKLHFDGGVAEEFKDILKKYFNIDKREELLAKEIKCYNSHNIMNENEITKEIEEKFNNLKNQNDNENNQKLLDMSFEILCLCPINKEKEIIKKYIETIIYPPRNDEQISKNPLEYLGFAEIVYNKKDKYKIKYINSNNLNYLIFIEYILGKICDEIALNDSLNKIKNKFYGINTQNDLEEFLIKIIRFIWDSAKTSYKIKGCIDYETSKKPIFLNMYNELISIDKIKMKEEFNVEKEDEEILLNICLNKHINKDYRKELMNEKLAQRLLDYKNKFNKCNLNEICDKIDNLIMEYDQENSKKENQYDNDFFNIIKEIEKIKYDKGLLGLTYYMKNKSRMSFMCLNKEEKNDIISCLCKENTKDQITFLKAFKDSQSLNFLKQCLKESDGNEKLMYSIFSSNLEDVNAPTLQLNQIFYFTIKEFDEKGNVKMSNYKPISRREEKGLLINEYKYEDDIIFEIELNSDSSCDENKFCISYNKQK